MLIILFISLTVFLALGIYAQMSSKDTFTAENYYLANRSLGTIALCCTLVATYVSSGSFIGGISNTYKYGYIWLWLAIIQIGTLPIIFRFFGPKFKKISILHNSITIPQLLGAIYKSNNLRFFIAVITLVGYGCMIVAQWSAATKTLEVLLQWPLLQSSLLFAVILAIYTTLGGFRAVVATDIVQFFVMLLGSATIVGFLIYYYQGLANFDTLLQTLPIEKISLHENNSFSLPYVTSFWILLTIGIMGLPATMTRVIAYKNDHSYKKVLLWAPILLGLTMFLTHFIGILMLPLELDPMVKGDKIVGALLARRDIVPAFVAGIFLSAIFAAIISTIDSMIIILNATLMHDLLKKTDDIHFKYTARIINILLITSLFLLSLFPPQSILALSLNTIGFMASCFTVITLLSVFPSNYHKKISAFSSILGGGGTYLILLTISNKLVLHPIAYTLPISCLFFFLGHVYESQKTKFYSP